MAEFELLQAMASRWDDGPVKVSGDNQLTVQLVTEGDELSMQIRSAEDAAVLISKF